MSINYPELEKALREMKPRQRLFDLVKNELKRRGHWKEKPRGKPFNKGDDSRRGNINAPGD